MISDTFKKSWKEYLLLLIAIFSLIFLSGELYHFLINHFYQLKYSFWDEISFKIYGDTIRNVVNGGDSVYFKSSYLLSYLKSIPILFYFGITLIVVFFNRKELRWKDFEFTKWTRVFVLCLGFLFIWSYALYDYNYVVNHLHLFERILLIVSFVVLFYSPAAIFLLVPLTYLSMAQFSGLFQSSLTDKMMPLNILLVTHVWILSRMFLRISFLKKKYPSFINKMFGILKPHTLRIFLSAILIVIAASYIKPFLVKTTMADGWLDWIFLDEFDVAIRKYMLKGWLQSAFSQDSITSILNGIGSLAIVMLVSTWVIQGFGFVIFISKRFLRMLFVLWFGFHFMVFIFTGIFFWKWMFVLVLMFLWTFKEKGTWSYLFNFKKSELFFTLVLFISFPFVNATKLGWIYTSYETFYEMDAIDCDGNKYSINLNNLTPFDLFFTFSNRWHLYSGKTIPSAVSQKKDFLYYQENVNIDNWQEIVSEKGENKYNEDFKVKFEIFVKSYFSNRNKTIGNFNLYNWIGPLNHIYTTNDLRYPQYKFDVAIDTIEITCNKCFVETSSLFECEEELVLTIPIN